MKGRLERFEERWEPHFGTAPWWDSICAQFEYVGDWDAPAQQAIEAMVYDLALAAGVDTTASCDCGRVYDAASCVECPACTREQLERDRIAVEEAVMREERRRAEWDAMTPEQRAAQSATMRIYLSGLISRDVQ